MNHFGLLPNQPQDSFETIISLYSFKDHSGNFAVLVKLGITELPTGKNLVQLWDRVGTTTSVSHISEKLATALVAKYGFLPDKTIWVQHCLTSYSTDLVHFQWQYLPDQATFGARNAKLTDRLKAVFGTKERIGDFNTNLWDILDFLTPGSKQYQ